MRGDITCRPPQLMCIKKALMQPAIIEAAGGPATREIAMMKMVAAGVTALFLATSPLAYAQQASSADTPGRLSAADLSALTDARIAIVKATLQLTPDQEKLWPPIEDAIRARAMDRAGRLATAAARVAEVRDGSLVDALRDRDPIAFMQRRAEALAQRSADLKKLADAWQPLYQTLTPEQKRRMAFLTILVLREMRNAVEQRRVRAGDEEDDED